MEEELSEEIVWNNIQALKEEYAKYKTGIQAMFQNGLPLSVANREKEIHWLLGRTETILAQLPRGNGFVNSEQMEELRNTGKQLYEQLQKQISLLDGQRTQWMFQVKEVLTELRICFFYLMIELEQAEKKGFEGINVFR